jgi:hypothetical protein
MLEHDPLQREFGRADQKHLEVRARVAGNDVQHSLGQPADVLEKLAALVQRTPNEHNLVTPEKVKRYEREWCQPSP